MLWFRMDRSQQANCLKDRREPIRKGYKQQEINSTKDEDDGGGITRYLFRAGVSSNK